MGWLSDGQMAALHRNFQGLFKGLEPDAPRVIQRNKDKLKYII